jgi:hypothetical protein
MPGGDMGRESSANKLNDHRRPLELRIVSDNADEH